MIRLIPRLLLVVLLATWIGGTAWGQPKPEAGPTNGSSLNNAQATSSHKVVNTSASPSGEDPQRFEVILSQERLYTLWPGLFGPNQPPDPAPSIDSEDERVVVYSIGTQPRECYSAELHALRSEGEGLLVEVTEKEAAPNCVCAFSLVEPFDVIRLDSREGLVTLCVRRPQLNC